MKLMRVILTLTLSLALGLGSVGAQAISWFKNYEPDVVVADPYLEVRTGPGRGYPVFYVAAEHDHIKVLKRKTNWYKIRVFEPREKEGWVNVRDLQQTLNLNGEPIEFPELDRDDFSGRRWELGFNGGDFGGASSLAIYLGYAVTPNITVQLEGGQILGEFSDGVTASANILMYPFPKWRLSPYFTIGTGIIETKPHTTIVQADDRQDEIVHAGLGANYYLSDRFILRMEYKRHTVLTSRDDNEEVDQWKAGFSVFF
ncbi:MAG: hypothetical protein ACI9UU_001138 [Candidatus Azotimanducaceae bacterium]|jgi:uncharacterized protein YgiM (DUF1202 family)